MDEPPILEIINLKTASLFSFACVSGGLAAQCSKEEEDILHDYGFNLGVAFQMADDLADLYETLKSGEPSGDFKTRKVSYPLFCLYISSPRLKDAVQRWVAGQLDLDSLMSLIEYDNSGLLLAKKKIAEYQTRSLLALDSLPESKYRDLLELVPKYVEMKMLEEVGALEEYLALEEGGSG